MSDAPVQTQAGLEAIPPMPVRRLHNFIYCPRLFYFQWVENIFQENADTVAGSHVHRNVDEPSKLDDLKELDFPEGSKLRSLRLESKSLGLIGVVEIVEGGPDGAEIIDYKKGSARRDSEGERVAKEPDASKSPQMRCCFASTVSMRCVARSTTRRTSGACRWSSAKNYF